MSQPNRAIAMALMGLAACAPGAPHDERAQQQPPPFDRLEDDGDRGPTRAAACPDHLPYVASVRTRVIDPAGVGIEDARVQLCVITNDARMLCLEPGRTDGDGDVLVDVAPAARCMVSAIARVLLPQSRRPALYCKMELPPDDASVTVPDPYLLVEAAAPHSLPPLGDEATARIVSFSTLLVDVTPTAIGADQYQRLAATALTLDQSPACLAAQAPAFDLLIAFAPEVDVMGEGFPFSIDNSLGLDAGETVDLFVQGGIDCKDAEGALFEKGAWHSIGSARVGDDAARIETVGQSALPCLGWIGVMR